MVLFSIGTIIGIIRAVSLGVTSLRQTALTSIGKLLMKKEKPIEIIYHHLH